MAIKNTNTPPTAQQRVQRSNRDNTHWVIGFLLLIVGLFGAVSTIFSFFYWTADQSGLLLSAQQRLELHVESENFCGWAGARLGTLLIDDSFGVFGILIPVMIILMGVWVIRQRPLLFNHSILALFLIMILGSLSLGVAFADRWSLCSSTGWGGAFGIEIAALLRMHIGSIGLIILLLGGWILTGVFINRNFINTVNTAGNAMVDKSEQLVEMVRHKVSSATASSASDLPVDEPVVDKPVASVAPVAPVNAVKAVQVPTERPKVVYAPQVVAPADDEEDPFLEIDSKATPAEIEINRLEPAEHTSEDGVFTEVDLSRSTDRVVMGAGGLVELAASDLRTTAPAAQTVVTDGPFTEITVNPKVDEVVDQQLSAPEPETPTQGIVVTVETNQVQLVDVQSISTDSYDPLKDLVNYRKPPVTLLEDYMSDSEVTDEEIHENKSKIEETLKNFGIAIQRIKATVGPTVTLYEIVQAQGIKISKIQNLENDIAQSLKALGIRIIAPIPGKGTIGIEVPNRDKQVVSMYSAIRSLRFQESKAELPIVIGRTIQNDNYVFDLTRMPHLLVAGATGQGKSVGLNAIITSLLYRKHPAQLKFVMIDPKMVEFSLYAKIEKHFLAKMESEDEAIITDPRKAVNTLNSLCIEMDNRLELCKKAGARNIAEYNERFVSRTLNPQNGHRYLPYIVVVVDEFADLIMTAREVEAPVMRLAQKARAVGIHLIIATQRPDVKVITGGIKANFPARIAFRVMQMIDSRTIIDQPGANQLIGRGDMLLSKDGELTRIQCALVETKEVERVVDYISKQQGYTAPYLLPDYSPDSGDGSGLGSDEAAPLKYDALFGEIARDAVSSGQISTSMIQRNYEVGFNRAGRIMMQLERAGIVGRQQGAKQRDILFHDSPSLEAKLQDLGVF
ncbi:MAG: DNA translocase FtsK 4TM domain-containing protein [Alistipes sp.]